MVCVAQLEVPRVVIPVVVGSSPIVHPIPLLERPKTRYSCLFSCRPRHRRRSPFASRACKALAIRNTTSSSQNRWVNPTMCWSGSLTATTKPMTRVIEESYRSSPKRRVLFGQSLGGQFVLYSAQTRPTLFWGHIASNPALHRNLELFLTMTPEIPPEDARSYLFVGSGSDDDPRFREPALQWINHWTHVEPKPWHLRVETLDGHTHMSAPPASFRRGIRWLFSDP